ERQTGSQKRNWDIFVLQITDSQKTSSALLFEERVPFGVVYHGNQDGDAARARGAGIPDVSQHAAYLPDKEEDLHFQ
ncbi:hypothetical protein AMECASPLE_024790, partial [Ameca splendens]